LSRDEFRIMFRLELLLAVTLFQTR
jgi:hypothetical protein